MVNSEYPHIHITPAGRGEWDDLVDEVESFDESAILAASAADLDVEVVEARLTELRAGHTLTVVIGVNDEYEIEAVDAADAIAAVEIVAETADALASKRRRGFAVSIAYYAEEPDQDEDAEAEGYDDDDEEHEEGDDEDDEEEENEDDDEPANLCAIVRVTRLARPVAV
jgi:hypothetical protein